MKSVHFVVRHVRGFWPPGFSHAIRHLSSLAGGELGRSKAHEEETARLSKDGPATFGTGRHHGMDISLLLDWQAFLRL